MQLYKKHEKQNLSLEYPYSITTKIEISKAILQETHISLFFFLILQGCLSSHRNEFFITDLGDMEHSLVTCFPPYHRTI